MLSVTWWKVGIVRVIALVIFAVGMNGLANAIERHAFWDISKMSAPTAGSLVLILLWVYYSAQILLLGAVFTRICALRRGCETVPTDNAISRP